MNKYDRMAQKHLELMEVIRQVIVWQELNEPRFHELLKEIRANNHQKQPKRGVKR